MTTTVKTCFKCGQVKPLTAFYAHPAMADGHLGKCKECAKRDVSNNYRANIDHFLTYERTRNKTPKRLVARKDYAHRRPTMKRRAAYLTSNAIRDGRLTRQPCERCGAVKSEAHHDDYSQPLAVRWLCRKHHLEHHGKVERQTA